MQPFSVSAVSALCHRVMGRSLRGATAGDRLMLDSFQGRFRGPRQHTSIRMKSRTVARTIPRPFGVVPVDEATQVRANGRHPAQFSLGIASRPRVFHPRGGLCPRRGGQREALLVRAAAGDRGASNRDSQNSPSTASRLRREFSCDRRQIAGSAFFAKCCGCRLSLLPYPR
jgi:hypothetical protein